MYRFRSLYPQGLWSCAPSVGQTHRGILWTRRLFPVQIRIVYFAFTLLGLLPEVRTVIYVILLLGTIMVTFFGRCSIALVLKHMPWNRGREVRLN